MWSLGGRGARFSRGLASDPTAAGASRPQQRLRGQREFWALVLFPWERKGNELAGCMSSRLRLSTGWVLKEAIKEGLGCCVGSCPERNSH